MSLLNIFVLLLCLVSCSIIDKVAVKRTAAIIQKASYEIETETSLEQFRLAVPGNIKLLEGFLSLDDKNRDLLSSLVKAHAGYAFAIYETEFLADQLDEIENSLNQKFAIASYSKAIDYALRYFALSGLNYHELSRASKTEDGIKELFDQKLSEDTTDIEAVFFFAHSLGSLINLQKSNMRLIAELGIVKGSFDWACGLRPEMNHGACDLFYGAFDAGRPKMLGGDHVKAKASFEKAMKKYPQNLLSYVSYLQYFVIPLSEEAIFKKISSDLKNRVESPEVKIPWLPETIESRRVRMNNHLNLFNEIALRRFEIISKRDKKLF